MTVTHFLLLLVLDIIILFQQPNNNKIDLILIESVVEFIRVVLFQVKMCFDMQGILETKQIIY
jgi:hypothetical protein